MLYFLIIFIIVLFIYIHLQFHWKVSDDTDIAHVTFPEKNFLETMGDIRQPFIFDTTNDSSFLISPTNIDVNMFKNYNDDKITVPHNTMISALKQEAYLSKNNSNFFQECGFNEKNSDLMTLLRPYFCNSSHHDILFGNHSITTPLLYSLNYRNYLYVCEGDVELILVPPKYSNYLLEDNNKTSLIDIWNPSQDHSNILQNIESIKVPLTKGNILFLPAYWWHSIKFNSFSCVSILSFRTYMNTVAITPQLIRDFIKEQNIKLI